MAKISATWAVHAGTYAEGELDVTGLSIDEVADRIDNQLDPYVSVCHQCSRSVSDPEAVELTGFTVDGRSYYLEQGQWQEWGNTDG